MNAKPIRDEAMRVFSMRLATLIERGKVAPATLVEKLRGLAWDLYDDVRHETSRSLWALMVLDILDPEDEGDSVRAEERDTTNVEVLSFLAPLLEILTAGECLPCRGVQAHP